MTQPTEHPLYYFDEQAAERPCLFIEKYCRHVEGVKQKERIELFPFWRDTIRDIFGWKRAEGCWTNTPLKSGRVMQVEITGAFINARTGDAVPWLRKGNTVQLFHGDYADVLELTKDYQDGDTVLHVRGEMSEDLEAGQPLVLDNFRRYTHIWLEIPKKQAKSIIMSALSLYMTGADGEKGAQVRVVAADKYQARIIFDAGRKMVEFDKTLSKSFHVLKDSITHKATNSYCIVLSSDVESKHGPNISTLFIDEMHAQSNRDLYDTLEKGTAARDQPLVFITTTAGYKYTFAHDMSLEARDILEGRVQSGHWYVRMFGMSEERAMKEWDTEAAWREVNPGYGITVGKNYYMRKVEDCKRSPAEVAAFWRLHLNVWTGSDKSWEVVPYWNNSDHGKVPEEELHGRECYCGIDFAPKRDTSAVVYLFPPKDAGNKGPDGKWIVLMRNYIPADTLQERKKQENDQWDVWVRTGLAITTPGNVTDFDKIADDVVADAKKFVILKIGADPYRATQPILKMQEAGLPAEEYPNTLPKLSPAMETVERLIIAGDINHQGNPLLAWMAGNVVVFEDAKQNRMPNKKNSKARIDGILGLIMAMGLATAGTERPQRSIYENEELWVEGDN
jgi:phage terminase large subunit-like protein